jgi:DNA-binding response OmpR family regulator
VARVLIADDDPMILRLMDVALGAAGHEVTTAVDGRDALDQMQQANPDIIVLDGMMPELGGLEVLQTLKSDAATSTIPVVLMTARAEEDDIARGLDLGASEYLVKPFPPKDLIDIIGRLSS